MTYEYDVNIDIVQLRLLSQVIINIGARMKHLTFSYGYIKSTVDTENYIYLKVVLQLDFSEVEAEFKYYLTNRIADYYTSCRKII